MKKFIFLIMLVLMSNLSLSQTTNTQNTNKHLSDTQMTEVYKGLKQGEYLKQRVKKSEEVINNANGVIVQQKQNISKQEEIIKGKNEIIDNLQFQINNNQNLYEAQKEQLTNNIKILEIQSKKDKRKKFWNGVKVGGISVAIIGAGAIYFLTK